MKKVTCLILVFGVIVITADETVKQPFVGLVINKTEEKEMKIGSLKVISSNSFPILRTNKFGL